MERDTQHPAAGEVVAFFCSRNPDLYGAPRQHMRLPIPPRSFLALISFLRTCRAKHSQAASSDPEVLQDAAPELPLDQLELMEHALVPDGSSELHIAALKAVLELSSLDLPAFAAKYSQRMPWLQSFLGHISAPAREIAAKLIGIATSALEAKAIETLLTDLSHRFPTAAKAADSKLTFEAQHGALAAAGCVLAQCQSGTKAVPQDVMERHTLLLARELGATNPGLAGRCALALGHAGLRQPLALPHASSQDAKAAAPAPPAKVSADVPPAGKDALNSEAEFTSEAVISRILKLKDAKDSKVIIQAATGVGYLAAGDPEASILQPAVDGLLSISSNKTESVLFAVGEALCFIFGGVPVTADVILHTPFESLAQAAAASEEAGQDEPEDGEAQPMATDVGPNSEAAEAAVQPGRSAAQSTILSRLLEELIHHSKPEVRCAGCIWLLALVSYTGRHPQLLPKLPDVQEAFSHLLGDPTELTQEMASRGMSIVYSRGDDAMRNELLASLTGTLQGGSKKRRAVKLEGETKVFEEGSMGEAPGGGSLSTYKELCALATDMGQPDLIYKFMDLANHQASLNSSRGAAFGFASIAKLAGERLQPYIAALVPKLYRYQYDPNARVRDSMVHIWRALIDNPKKTVDENFDAIATELLKEMGGRLWRNREASCSAMTDLIQGRRWGEVKAQFSNIWEMTFRVIDDIKESVRGAALGLAKSLRSLSLRIMDVQHSSASEAGAAVAVALPFLLQKGMMSEVKEVQSIALTTISRLVQSAGKEQIQPHLVDLTIAMLESLSGMEDSRLNYVEQHAERMGLDSSRLENLRVSASRSTPMGDTLDLCARYTDASVLDALGPRLATLVRRGVGLNTRVGAARFISSLAMRLGSDMRRQSGSLITALVAGTRAERSMVLRRAFASAAGAVAKYAAPARVDKLVAEAVAVFTEPGDQEARLVSGLLLRELSRQAPEAFSNCKNQVMPLAFLARTDEDADVAKLWGEVWEEGSMSQAAALRLYISDLAPLLLQSLTSSQWGRKQAAADAMRGLAEAAPDVLQPHATIMAAALLKELPGRLWDGKESILKALAALCKACPSCFGLESQPSSTDFIGALLDAAARKKAAFCLQALVSLEVALQTLPGDHGGTIIGPLHDAIMRSTGDESTSGRNEAKEGGAEEAPPKWPLAESLKCLGAACPHMQPPALRQHGPALAASLAHGLKPGHPWPARMAALNGMKVFAERLAPDVSAAHSSAKALPSAVPTDISTPWLETLVPGVLEGMEDGRLTQVRAAALDALAAVLAASQQATLLPEAMKTGIEHRVSKVACDDKSMPIRAQAAAVQATLVVAPLNGASAMDQT
ncbi:hypothetical protein WJX84_005115 [Apatococcus fuscideae]|uniref:Proteasome adapter and scaffold protein ECM29 HEAT-repeat domain-containing protein n=1 Tax=Apatococcus fuscideae TaxID=2026836 RepID=A0AAW1SNN3_9CHLO